MGKRTGYMSRILVPRDRIQQASNNVKEWDPVDDLNTLMERIGKEMNNIPSKQRIPPLQMVISLVNWKIRQ
jgi:hypothetical protein